MPFYRLCYYNNKKTLSTQYLENRLTRILMFAYRLGLIFKIPDYRLSEIRKHLAELCPLRLWLFYNRKTSSKQNLEKRPSYASDI